MVDFPKYNSYKDSGVEWLGEIPSHWNIKKLKFMVRIKNGQDYKAFEVQEPGYPVIGSGGRFAYASKYLFEGESVLLGRKGTIDKPLYVNGAFWTVDTMFYSKIYSNTFPKFFYYCASTIPFGYYSTNTAVPSMTQEALGNHIFTYPPIEEQKRIVEFLERKTAEIDQAIAQKQRLIALLQEQKAILINQAVTKGLNPNVIMRDSGFEWLEEIPKHWQLKRVKQIFKLIIEPAHKNNDMELLSVYSDIGVRPRRELEERGNKASTTDGYLMVRKGDLIINKLLAWMGAIGLSNYEGVTSPAYDVLRPNLKISGDYFNYLFRMPTCSSELKKHSRGIMEMRLRLYFDKFGVIKVPFPPFEEQEQIATFIQYKEVKFEEVFLQIKKEIFLLNEFKAVLISQAVTGKIKV